MTEQEIDLCPLKTIAYNLARCPFHKSRFPKPVINLTISRKDSRRPATSVDTYKDTLEARRAAYVWTGEDRPERYTNRPISDGYRVRLEMPVDKGAGRPLTATPTLMDLSLILIMK